MTATLPHPTAKVVKFDQIATLDQASDYALAGYHAAMKKSSGNAGAVSRLWTDAANAYATAYGTILALRPLAAADGVKQATAALHDANHLADQASVARASA